MSSALKRRFLLPALALLVSVVAALAVGEVAIRLMLPQPRLVITPGGLYETDPPGRCRLTPGYEGRIYNRAEFSVPIRVNRYGLRGPEIGSPTASTLRVLAIGDSFVFGVGVGDDETFVAELARRLTRPGRPAEGLNAGVPTFGVPDAEGWLARHGAALEPNVVVLGVFLGNDLIDASPARPAIHLVDGLMVPAASPGGVKAWLHRRSHLYVALKGLLERPGLAPLRSRLGLAEPWTVRTLREEFAIYHRDAPQVLAPAIEATDAALGRLAERSRAGEFDLVALLIPSEVQLDPSRWTAALHRLGLDPGVHDPAVPGRIFRRLLARHGIPVIDPAPELARKMAAGEELYFSHDRHWTAAGHVVAAAELARSLAAAPVGSGAG